MASPIGVPAPHYMARSAIIGFEPCTCVETLVSAGSWSFTLIVLRELAPMVKGACGLAPEGRLLGHSYFKDTSKKAALHTGGKLFIRVIWIGATFIFLFCEFNV